MEDNKEAQEEPPFFKPRYKYDHVFVIFVCLFVWLFINFDLLGGILLCWKKETPKRKLCSFFCSVGGNEGVLYFEEMKIVLIF